MWLDAQNRGLVIWIAGLAGSGKSTIGRILVERIREEGVPVVYLDGDEFRDLLGHYSYDKAGRIDVAKKRIEFAHFLSMQGIVTVVTTISLFDEVFDTLKQRLPHLFTVFLDVSLQTLCSRDQKQLYSRALQKQLSNVVGVDIMPDSPSFDFTICNDKGDVRENALRVFAHIAEGTK
ncbi:MAG: adenylyl-sulfate kinase [Helicobacter sp.]|nr:adenylyl-sulfate kinase [Helicobacter sp.]